MAQAADHGQMAPQQPFPMPQQPYMQQPMPPQLPQMVPQMAQQMMPQQMMPPQMAQRMVPDEMTFTGAVEDFHSTTPIGSKPLIGDGGLGWDTKVNPQVAPATGRAGATRVASDTSLPVAEGGGNRKWILFVLVFVLAAGGGAYYVLRFVL